jgi:RnfABCDGE-type electron transport complex B subunit
MTILYSVLLLTLIGVVVGVSLYYIAQRFKVIENPKIDEVEAMLPGANCGGCGYPGCRKFAEILVNSDTLEGLYCSPASEEQMNAIAEFLGKTIEKRAMQVAVVKCGGTL